MPRGQGGVAGHGYQLGQTSACWAPRNARVHGELGSPSQWFNDARTLSLPWGALGALRTPGPPWGEADPPPSPSPAETQPGQHPLTWGGQLTEPVS